jgi:hypothetical protein
MTGKSQKDQKKRKKRKTREKSKKLKISKKVSRRSKNPGSVQGIIRTFLP